MNAKHTVESEATGEAGKKASAPGEGLPASWRSWGSAREAVPALS